MRTARKLESAARAGFTLLEMMVVIIIIGILSTYLIVNVPEWTDKARMNACEANMRRAYTYMVSYTMDREGQWPRDQGSKFWLRMWKDGHFERTESHAKMFFCPGEPYQSYLTEEGQSVIDYLNDWDSLGENSISYAGFSSGGDRSVRNRLTKNPGFTAILSDSHMIHRAALIYMTADGVSHKLLRADLENEYGLDLEMDDIYPGPGCEVEILQTVSTE